MRINKDIVQADYIQYFRGEYFKCGNKIDITKKELEENTNPERIVLLQNKIIHLTDRQISAKAILDNNYDQYDLIGADLYTIIWGKDNADDRYKWYRYDPKSILFKIREDNE